MEKKITLAQERALEQAETDSLCTSLGPDDDTNYTFAEPEQDNPDHNMGSPSEHLLNYSGRNVIYYDELFMSISIFVHCSALHYMLACSDTVFWLIYYVFFSI